MINFEKLKQLYKLGRNLSLEDVQILFKSGKNKSYEASTYLIKEGAISKEVILIRKGLIRIFLINEKGDEITIGLRWENQILANRDAVLFNEPSRFYYETLEPTETYEIDYELLQEIIAKNPKLGDNRKYIFHNMLKEVYQRLDSFVLLNPEERYIEFVESNPDIVNRVPNKYIANILGITPVSLSRIRKRIASKKK